MGQPFDLQGWWSSAPNPVVNPLPVPASQRDTGSRVEEVHVVHVGVQPHRAAGGGRRRGADPHDHLAPPMRLKISLSEPSGSVISTVSVERHRRAFARRSSVQVLVRSSGRRPKTTVAADVGRGSARRAPAGTRERRAAFRHHREAVAVRGQLRVEEVHRRRADEARDEAVDRPRRRGRRASRPARSARRGGRRCGRRASSPRSGRG